MRELALFLVLLATWVLLSGQTSAFLFACGVVSCALVTWLTRRLDLVWRGLLPLNPITLFVRYLPWLAWQVVIANIDVAWRVWHPRLPIEPSFARLPRTTRSGASTTLLANSITLTPGTVTVAVEDDCMVVHALSKRAAESVESGSMDARVRAVETSPEPAS